MKKLLITFGLLLIFAISGYLFYREGTLPVNKTEETPQIFVIQEGESTNSIINTLMDQKLIRSRLVFFLIVKQKGIERSIQAGDYRLKQSMNAFEIADELTHGTVDVWVTIPEGLRKEEIGEIMSAKFDIPETEFDQLANEGYLFPDTYLVPKNPTADQIVSILQNTFDQKYSEEIAQNSALLGLSEREVVTIASLVEREAKFDQDRQKVASVILRRLQEGMPLQIDATVQYALGYQPSERDWWKSSLTYQDLKIDSAYNTYTNSGLPPGPICNPGLSSLEAVSQANPDTPYLYYVSEPNGTTHFSETYEKHLQNVDKYL